jgi:lysophospholipase L1-like esterase
MEREGRSESNLGFDANKVKVYWSTYGGATVRPGDSSRSLLNLLSEGLSCQPDVVYLHIGENDLGVLKPDQISGAISSLSFYISSVCPSVKFFICSELLPFPKFREQFQSDPMAAVGPVNASLSAAMEIRSIAPLPGTMSVKFWRHEMGVRTSTDLFKSDRVHLNDVGMERYYRSVRAAIGFALNKLV